MSRSMRAARRRALAASLLATVAVACASLPPSNAPLGTTPPRIEQSIGLDAPGRSGRVLLVLTFSGGGTRAAAFAQGALQELAETRVRIGGAPAALFDEIDLVSTVSGGSFTGAYLGLHGRGIFEDFEEVFLRKNVQARLVLEVLRPRYWLGLLRVDRSQRAARLYDRLVFHGAKLGDLGRGDEPRVVINATDLSTASRFPFSPPLFALLCSDFDAYPVADAVTASSAVPIIFPTVRLHNYASSCAHPIPALPEAGSADPGILRSVMRHQIEDQVRSIGARECLHLLDGGISDTLGLTNGLAALSLVAERREWMEEMGHPDLELILVVTVNAEPKSERPWDRLDRPASALQVVSGLSGGEIGARNELMLQLARAGFRELAARLSTPEQPVGFELVEVSFERVADPAERSFLRGIETSFHLGDEEVDRLIGAARQVLRESPALARAIARLEQRPGAGGD